MQYAWLEKLAASGRIREDVKAAIYRDCEAILKVAASKKPLFTPEQLTEQLKEMKSKAILAALGGAATLAMSSIAQGIRMRSDVKRALNLRESILKDPEVVGHQDKALARFNEIASIAPTIAGQPQIAPRLVKARLHTGLTEQDVANLTMLQTGTNKDERKYVDIFNKAHIKRASARTGALYGDIYNLLKLAGADKLAAPKGLKWPTVKRFGAHLALMSGVPILTGLTLGVGKEIMARGDRKKMQEALAQSFNAAMKQSDPNKEPLHSNRDKAHQAFQALVHFAPHVAAEPGAARAFMNSVVAGDMGVNVSHIKEVSEIQRNLTDAKNTPSPFFAGLQQGVEFMGLNNIIQNAVNTTSKPVFEGNSKALTKDLGFKATRGGKNSR